FQNFISQRNSEVLSSKYVSEWRVEIKKASRHFFLQKNGEGRRKSSLHAATAALHSKGAAFSSLPRRNKMKPGHLHQTPEKPYLLVHRSLVRRWMKSLSLVACEDVSLTLHLLVTA
ncbi:MAG: hypothetical protein IJW17_09100, partial [Lentisphaeria bacterium]|nr:hypothetical protein [Lentisphaeria bacterium]